MGHAQVPRVPAQALRRSNPVLTITTIAVWSVVLVVLVAGLLSLMGCAG